MAGQGLEVAPAPAPPVTGTPVMGLGKGITASLVVALFVALGEINRLSAQVLDAQARSWSFTTLMGPGAFWTVDGWSVIFPAYADERATWLAIYVALDIPVSSQNAPTRSPSLRNSSRARRAKTMRWSATPLSSRSMARQSMPAALSSAIFR